MTAMYRAMMVTKAGGPEALTCVELPIEDQINRWLADVKGTLVKVTQSESERTGGGQHVTVCLWYVPGGDQPAATGAGRGTMA